MSITTDIRSYADTAVSQGKHVLDQAQAQLNDVTGQANEFYGKTKENVSEIAEKATSAVHDLRAQAEKAVNLEAIKTAVEPYLEQVKGYTHQVTDRAESLFGTVKNDPRLAKFVDVAEVVIETVQERVVKPVQSLTGLGAPAPVAKPAPAAATKPATTKPAATKPATAKPASKPAARKAPAKRTPKS
jgi:replicative DNA helicase